MDDSKEVGEKARVSNIEEVELNDSMETEGLGCDMGMENESQDTCEECQNVEKCSSSNSGPWIVNNKLLVVQKWDPSINLDRTEPTRLPVWIKLINIPLEAWTHRGLSTLESRVGKPLIMDAMTTKMCNEGLGSLRYARILIEANATKGLVDFMEVLYVNKQNGEQKKKEIKKNQEVNKAIDCFVNVKSRKSKDDGIKSNNICIGRNMQQNNQKKPFQKKEVVSKFVYRQKQPQGVNIEQIKKVNEEHDKYNTPSGSIRKVWSVGENVIKDVRDTANKFSVLQEIKEESTMMKMNLREKSKVEKFVKEKIQPSINKAKDWTKEMTEYFKECWKEHYDKSMEVENEGQSMLYHVEILSSQKSFFCTFIYTANRGKDRKELWKDLRLYKKIVGYSAWTIMGDVNLSLNLEDHSEGISHFTQDMLEFQDFINEIEMEDINWSGMHSTWTKSLNNPYTTVLKKINIVMGNLSFLTHFSSANAIFLPYGISDHSPTILTIPQGHAMFRMVKNLKALKPHINKLNWKHGNLLDRIITLKKKLHDVQAKIDKDPFNKSPRQEGVQVLSDYKEASNDEEKLLRQKAKFKWLKNFIIMKDQFVKHFEGFLGISPEVAKFSEEESLLFEKKVSSEDVEIMIKEISNDEIKKALFDIEDNKAPRPDGFTSRFFKKSWEIIKDDFCAAIKEFFESGKLLREINATLIALVPKSTTPQKVSNFRPIACCNVTCKCISKILTNRIKNASHIVDDNESAFILGRAITDNILLVQELLKGYNCANGPKRRDMDISRGRGLRQGDPISPYIFTIVIEWLNIRMKDEIRKEKQLSFTLDANS
nr:hypothetical protein [Tanacetum cinerariifolium]